MGPAYAHLAPRRGRLFPVFLDFEGPVESEVVVIVVIKEFGDGIVVAAHHPATRGLAFDNYP